MRLHFTPGYDEIRLWRSTLTLYHRYKRSPALYKVTSMVHFQGNDTRTHTHSYSLMFSEPTRDSINLRELYAGQPLPAKCAIVRTPLHFASIKSLECILNRYSIDEYKIYK